MAAFGVLSVEEVKSRCESGEKVRLIDVREPSEYRIGHLDRSELRPLGLIRQWMESLPDRDEEIILYCHHGLRSEQAASFLAQHGFTRVNNMAGGIDAWSRQIDPSIPRY